MSPCFKASTCLLVALLHFLPGLAVHGQEVGPATGSLVIVGGGMTDRSIPQRFVELAGGDEARIVVVPTAGGREAYDDSNCGLGTWQALGVASVTCLHTMDPAEADGEEFVKPVLEATAVWFNGGRQWRIVDSFHGTRAEEEFRRVLERGGVIGGSSAGATIQGSYLVRGDTAGNTIMMGSHQVGFGYLKDTAIDQHVLRRNRQFDLIEVIETHPELLGIGIDENTAIVVQGDEFEVMGQSYVLIYDNRKTVGADGRFYFIPPGGRFNLRTREATRGEGNDRPIEGPRPGPWPGWGDRGFRHHTGGKFRFRWNRGRVGGLCHLRTSRTKASRAGGVASGAFAARFRHPVLKRSATASW